MNNLTTPLAPLVERAITRAGSFRPVECDGLPVITKPLARHAFTFDEPLSKGRVVADYVDVINPTSKRAAKSMGRKTRVMKVRNWQVRNSSIQ